MQVKERLELLRNCMKDAGVDGYIITTEDFHASEYVGAYFRAREYMSGFTGSSGTLVVLMDEAQLFTDGRYFIQAEGTACRKHNWSDEKRTAGRAGNRCIFERASF